LILPPEFAYCIFGEALGYSLVYFSPLHYSPIQFVPVASRMYVQGVPNDKEFKECFLVKVL
jgi:hypothetical protein